MLGKPAAVMHCMAWQQALQRLQAAARPLFIQVAFSSSGLDWQAAGS